MPNTLTDLHQLVWTALMAAMVAAGAYLIFPIGPVPISMQPFFVFLAGFALGPKHGLLALGLYLLAGTVGLPVFSGGHSGLGHLIGPTGGYLFGFALAAWLCGFARRSGKIVPWGAGLAWGGVALLLVYALGGGWLKFALDMTWTKAWLVGVVPFIPWDGLKVIAALVCVRYLFRFGLLPGQR